jgi:hypothetical protein
VWFAVFRMGGIREEKQEQREELPLLVRVDAISN